MRIAYVIPMALIGIAIAYFIWRNTRNANLDPPRVEVTHPQGSRNARPESTPKLADEYSPCNFIDYDDGEFGITFRDFDPFQAHIEDLGGQGGGYSWTAMIKAVAKKRGLAIPEKSFDPEADMFAVSSKDKATLKLIVGIIRDLIADRLLMNQAIADAKQGNYWD